MNLYDLYYCYNNGRNTLDDLTPFNTEFTLIDEAMYGPQDAGVIMSLSEIKNQSDIRHVNVTRRIEYTIFDFNNVNAAYRLSEMSIGLEDMSYLGGAIEYDDIPFLNKKQSKWRKLMIERG